MGILKPFFVLKKDDSTAAEINCTDVQGVPKNKPVLVKTYRKMEVFEFFRFKKPKWTRIH